MKPRAINEKLRVESPLADALQAISGEDPPAYTKEAFAASDLSDANIEALQEWCSIHARPAWSTGIGMLEAAELIVREAVDNANIAGPAPRRVK